MNLKKEIAGAIIEKDNLAQELFNINEEFQETVEGLEVLQKETAEQKGELNKVKEQYEKLRVMLEQKGYSRKRRENTETTWENVTSVTSSTRYRRRKETKNILEYIHGGSSGSLYGAWDYLQSHGDISVIQKMILSFKRGKFLEKLYGKFSCKLEKSESSLKKAVAQKFHGHLSRRKFAMICKIQKSSFSEDGMNTANSVNYGDCNIRMRSVTVNHNAVDKFVKSLDMGDIHQLPGYCGVSRTVSALITMITDLNLKVKSKKDGLQWFNGNKNHFVVEFSDDGAPESREKSMSIGTLTFWNFGAKVRSRDYHFPLHLVTANEKADICELLWRQHSDEMELIENNVFTINDEKTTFEFQPSADQAWQYWAVNSLTQSATYPSPYGNVHKDDLTNTNEILSLEEGIVLFSKVMIKSRKNKFVIAMNQSD